MIRIAVCDDENVIVNQIEHIISEVCKRESIPVNIDVFYSGRELKRQVTSGTKYDIIFLDIQMKGAMASLRLKIYGRWMIMYF